MSEKDGGPAFPATGMYAWNEATQQADHLQPSQGMSLRDHFAGLAMQGEIAGMDQDASLSRNEGETWDEAMARDVRRRAKFAYQNADAMLAERAKGQPVDPVAEAAPDLLEALSAIQQHVAVPRDQRRSDWHLQGARIQQRADAAIAKATRS